MGDDIGSGLGSVCFDFRRSAALHWCRAKMCTAEYVRLGQKTTSKDNLSLNPNRCHHP